MEVRFEDLGMDLLYVVEACGFVEIRELLFEEPSS